jgi:hypothetical protein
VAGIRGGGAEATVDGQPEIGEGNCTRRSENISSWCGGLVDLGRRESSGQRLPGSISDDGNRVMMSTLYMGDGRLAAAHR